MQDTWFLLLIPQLRPTCDQLDVSVPIEWLNLLYINRFQLIPNGYFYLCLRLQLLSCIWQLAKPLL